MRWEDERYVRLYTRDTTEWMFWPWQARATMPLLLRKADRIGVIDGVGEDDGFRGMGLFLGIPDEVAIVGVRAMVASGAVEHKGRSLVFRNFLEAQESSQSPNLRQQESRRRARDRIRSGLPAAAQRETCIYFVQSENGGAVKIGIADDVAKRLAGMQTSRPDKLLVLAAVPGTPAAERQLHETFAGDRQKGEWFSPAERLLNLVSECSQTGILPELSRFVTGHKNIPVTSSDTVAVTPSLAVPSLAVPEKALSISKAKSTAALVFEFWQETMESPRSKLDPKRERLIKARLAEGRTADDLKAAITGCSQDAFSMGENDRAQVYNGIELICRDAAHVEKFMALAAERQQRPAADSYHRETDEEIERRILGG